MELSLFLQGRYDLQHGLHRSCDHAHDAEDYDAPVRHARHARDRVLGGPEIHVGRDDDRQHARADGTEQADEQADVRYAYGNDHEAGAEHGAEQRPVAFVLREATNDAGGQAFE